MSRNQPENLIKVFIFIFGAFLIFGFFIYIWFSFASPLVERNKPPRETVMESDKKYNENKSSSNSSASKNLDLVTNLSLNNEQEVLNQDESSFSKIPAESASSSKKSSTSINYSNSNEESNNRGNYEDQIGAYDIVQN
jgi:hypothetical protein